MVTAYVALPDNTSQVLESLDDLRDLWLRQGAKIWVDLESPSDETVQRMDEIFDLDDDSLADCLYGEQRPRVDEFTNYIFLVLYGLHGLKEQEELDPHKLSAFCGDRFLVTIHRHPLLSIRQIRARCGRHPESLLLQGVDVVLYNIIDTMIDNYLRVAERFELRLEDLEERAFTALHGQDLLEEVVEVRREIVELRRLAVAQRQLLLPIAKGEFDFVSSNLSLRFSHVCDHLSQVIETVDGLRETIVSVRDNYHASLTIRTNEIIKLLTLYAAIMLPLTVVTGIYGMNLPLWPPQDNPLSFWIVMGGMFVIGGGLFVHFRRRKWW